jgi:CO/xanthine dehydrogenase FAD-binding subunit
MTNAYSPRSLDETYALLAEHGGRAKVIAGGTDLMVLINARQLEAREFVDIWALNELRGITEDGPTIRIGALTSYTQIINSPLCRTFLPSLVAASRTIGAIQIQNRGTLGGNIVNASPAGDTLPVLAAFDAELEIGSARGPRKIGFNSFYTGYRRTRLEPDELLLAVRLKRLRDNERDFFAKVGTRRAQAISKTVLGARIGLREDFIESIQIGIGSVAPTVVRARQTEQLLAGQKLTDRLIEQARSAVEDDISPITDLRSTAHYRRVVTGNVLARFLRALKAG